MTNIQALCHTAAPHLLAQQAAQHSELPAAAVHIVRLAAGVVVADVDQHQLRHACTHASGLLSWHNNYGTAQSIMMRGVGVPQ